ncbi:FAD-dependent monooxygenase [Streptomyces sp. AV19]|uniref:FAD-dependent monooxygenase n=1 Tax=Streptomyces sp. AV19 TaxID=2793068 RepID=UPI0018FEA6E4|nr:FAD-dependent monooxygenase [Streptomyces sp. AV19]MBH1933598.1 FAD-dependent monooxygenase [Streptomyces sp. AV19]MDG4535935.1 FAD-dependent monooxygenase [Streptomyces sp. AV19]
MTTADTAGFVIAGAGIGGLTAALALHARGIRATVLEAAGEILPLGVGINVRPAAIAELTALGFAGALAATGIPTREHRYVDHRGVTLWTEPRGLDAGYGHPQYSVHRGELQSMLLDAVRERLGPGAVRTGLRLHDFERGAGGVRVEARDAADRPVLLEAAALVGADGVRSVVRDRLHPGRSGLSAGKVRMWRGLTELDGFLDGRTMIVAADDRATRLIAYPVSARAAAGGGALLNWVCLVGDPAAGTAGDAGIDRPGEPAEVLPHLEHWSFDWLDLRAMVLGSPRILHYPMVDRDPLERWGGGRVTLLGDAAHLMYPIGANGASQAILDAAALAAHCAEHADPAVALERYEEVRRPATTAIVLANREMDRAERAMASRPDGDKPATLAEVTTAYRATVERRPATG